jgi:hypothetical protein
LTSPILRYGRVNNCCLNVCINERRIDHQCFNWAAEQDS